MPALILAICTRCGNGLHKIENPFCFNEQKGFFGLIVFFVFFLVVFVGNGGVN